MSPGESTVVNTQIVTSAIPAKLDLATLIDLSGSYGDDLVNIKNLDDGMFDSVHEEVPDLRVSLGTFVDYNDKDYPGSPWGSFYYGDYAFKLDQDFTTDKAVWTGAISALSTKYGGDEPESQYAGLKGLAESASWRSDATKVIAITTDASFHVPSDTGGTYPGPSRDATVAALNAKNIKVIAIKAPDSGAQMDDIALVTGGSVVTTGSSSAEIANAILQGLGNLPVTVTPSVVGCSSSLSVIFTPGSQTVVGGNDALFTGTIAVLSGAPQGTTADCGVIFKDENGNEIGDQSITVTIPDTTAPVITLNGDTPINIEYASAYDELGAIAIDNVDENVEVIVTGDVNNSVLGSYLVKYNATDAAGNEAVEVTRTVNVVDTTAPVITLNGEGIIDIEYGGTYDEPGAIAVDNVDENVEVIVTGDVNTSVLGFYTLYYNATDAAGNVATEVKRKVNVVDTTAPVLTCTPGVNPSGKTVPNKNAGFRLLEVYDNVDGVNVPLFINGFGPFANGDNVKITIAGSESKMEKMGGGKANAIVANLTLNGDAVLTATDSSGNTSSIVCFSK